QMRATTRKVGSRFRRSKVRRTTFRPSAQFGAKWALAEGDSVLSIMFRDLRFIVGLSLWAAVSACNGCLGCLNPVFQTGSNLPPSCQTQAPLVDAQKLDVLFVVDNS